MDRIIIQLQLDLENLIAKFFKLSFTIKFINNIVLFNNKKLFIYLFKNNHYIKKNKQLLSLTTYTVSRDNIYNIYFKNYKLDFLKIDNDEKKAHLAFIKKKQKNFE